MKEIPGYPNYYACEKGFIYSTKRKSIKKLKGSINSNTGYLQLTLLNNGIQKSFLVHQLIMLAFKGGYPNLLVINHLDGNKQNNRIGNLEYCTRSANQLHAYATGLQEKGEKNGMAILKNSEVLEIKKYLNNTTKFYGMLTGLGLKYGVSKHVIFKIKSGKNWGHLKG